MATRKVVSPVSPPLAKKSQSKATPPAALSQPTVPQAIGSAHKGPKAGKRDKPVRDSFTMPSADFALIGTLKERALVGKREAKKSELLRAGLHALAQLDSAALVAALDRLALVKVGRPKNG